MLIASGKHGDAAQVVQQCRSGLGDVEPRLLLAFCGGKHEPRAVLAALRDAFGPDVPVVGGSAAGVIVRAGLGYSGLELALAAFVDGDPVPRLVSVDGLDHDERAAGRALAASLVDGTADGSVVLLFYASVAQETPLRLHPASGIVEGFEAGIRPRHVRLIGAGMLTDLNFSKSWVFDGRGVARHGAVALVFPPDVVDETVIMHGCRPVSQFMQITRMAGAQVYELDGQPALDVIERSLGLSGSSAPSLDLSLIATLGQKQGDPYAPYDENAYVNRVILHTDRAQGSVTLFEPDFELGSRVQIMSRDNLLMLESVRDGATLANRRLADRETFLGLYIDCAGRASVRSGSPVEEADPLRTGLDPRIPLLGFYSGVEIGPFEGYSRPLDWTGVLTLLIRRR